MNSPIKILNGKLYLAAKLSLSIKLLLIIFACSVCASVEFKYSGDHKIETVIGANELNRIGVISGEVIEVIGDENKYALYWSGDFRNLFIKPKIEVGETIELSLIMPQGGARDIRFTVGDSGARTIFINLGSELKSSSPDKDINFIADPQLKSEITSMMRAMIENEKGKYYAVQLKRVLKQSEDRLITQRLSYRYRNLCGAVLSVKNLTSKSIDLLESDFSNLFKDTVAINLESYELKSGATLPVFIITRAARRD